MVTQVLHRLARSLHHVAFQLIAVLRRLSDVLQGRVRHTSPKETNASPCELSSYRLISNLSFLSKLLEHVISVQLTGYLSSAGLLSVHQLAYWRFHSTDSALPKVVTDITEAIDAGDHALLGLLNLSAAFDTVDHDVLAEHLSRTYRVRSTALDWLRSYLIISAIADRQSFTARGPFNRSPAPSHQELQQIAAFSGCEGGCHGFCHFSGGPLQQPARRSASWTDSSRCSMPP